MIDIHCHILPELDDGSKSLEESIEMARIAYDDGVRHIIATPHYSSSFMKVNRALVEEKLILVQNAINEHQIDITIHPGNEVRIDSAQFVYESARKEDFCYLDPEKRFVLLEMKWKEYDVDTNDVVRWFRDRGTTPIIPHPERHTFFRQEPKLLEELIAAGAWTQVTVDSLLGKNTADAQKFAEWLLDNDYVHTIATDAHNTNRKPNLSEGCEIIRNYSGEKRLVEILDRLESIIDVAE